MLFYADISDAGAAMPRALGKLSYLPLSLNEMQQPLPQAVQNGGQP